MAYKTKLDGFDYYPTGKLSYKWPNITGTIVVASSGGRRDSGCLKLTKARGTRAYQSLDLSSHIVVRLAVKLTASDITANKANILFTLWNGNTPQLFVTILPGTLFLQVWRHAIHSYYPDRNDPQLLGTSNNPILLDVWQHIELAIFVSNSGTLKLGLNGSFAAGFDTINADTYHTGLINGISLGAPALIDNIQPYGVEYYGLGWYDDFHITYGNELVFLGDRRVDYLQLSSDSTPQDFIVSEGNAWETLNSEIGSIQSDTVGDVSRFLLEGPTHSPLEIDTIQLVAHSNKSDSGTRAVKLSVKLGPTTFSGDDLYLSQTPEAKTTEFQINPATSLPWTIGDLTGLDIGVEVTV